MVATANSQKGKKVKLALSSVQIMEAKRQEKLWRGNQTLKALNPQILYWKGLIIRETF